ncbi:hypothetical protein H0H93_003503 [Arthromyces matolae]|nr:hypothetical protein H0H93_003503 [Arthromyces matolae]
MVAGEARFTLFCPFCMYPRRFKGNTLSPPNPKPTDGKPVDPEDEEDISERMSTGDAWLFPIMGSVALLGFYLVIKYLGKDWINWILRWYFSVAGVASVWKSIIASTRFILGETRWKSFDHISFTLKKGAKTFVSLSWRTPSVFLFPIAIIPSAVSAFSAQYGKSALLSNIMALSFSHNAISLLKIDSFGTGAVLLSGLFFYDIWWVFGTEVMVKVATTLEVPIKLLWPKSLTFAADRGFTMLGLGDIVIPGTVIAFALRYDYHQAVQGKTLKQGSFSKPYFYATLTGYFLGLVTTMAVMHNFKKAQPALLYLSPAGILSFVITAAIRGELREALNWKDLPEPEPSEIAGERLKKEI